MTDSVDPQWNKQYEKLVEFQRKNGHCIVPTKYHMEDVSLGTWVSWQRQFHSNNRLRLDRKELTWHLQYQKLVAFKRKNGHCLVPRKYQKDASLGEWVITQRQFHRNNRLPLDREVLLNEIGFVWRVRNSAPSAWQQQYEKLVEFKRKNGHCLVPAKYQEDVSLGVWVTTQRTKHINNKLPVDRKELLEDIGFVWKGRVVRDEKLWNQQYEKLVEFKRKNGDCLVPQKYEHDMSLGNWVSKQRQVQAKKKLPQEREALLNEIDFVWKGDTLAAAARSSTTHVSCRHWIIISRFIQKICLTLVLVLLLMCVLGIGVGFRSDHHQCGTSK
jgi:uncharacterized protein YbgA (DUF1722 family)